MTPQAYGRYVLREFRGSASRLGFFVLCLAVGVAAIVVVSGLSSGLEEGLRGGAKELLGADISVSYRGAPSEEVEAVFARYPGLQRTDVRRQPGNLVARSGNAPGRSMFVEFQSVSGPFLYYGSLGLIPDTTLADVLGPDTVVVMREIASRLEITAGDTVQIGDLTMTVAAVATKEPDRTTDLMNIGPRVFLTKSAFEAAGLADLGVRVQYATLFKIPDTMTPDDLAATGAEMESALEPIRGARLETYLEGRPMLQRGLERVERFSGLIALLSLLLGGVGVAQAIRAWITSRLDAIAVLKCLGTRPHEVFLLYAGQAALLGLLGSAVGVLSGVIALFLIPPLFSAYLPATLIQPWQPAAYLRGVALGVGVALVFSVPSLFGVLRVSPALVLRRDAEPLTGLRGASWFTSALVLAGVVAMAYLQAGSGQIALYFSVGVGVTSVLLAVAAFILTAIISRIPRDLGSVWLRHGLAALARPGASTLASMMSLGLGMLVLFCVSVVQQHLYDRISNELPQNIPAAIMLDVRPAQAEGLATVLHDSGAEDIRVLPVINARVLPVLPEEEASVESTDPNRGGGRRGGMRPEMATAYADQSGYDDLVQGEWWHLPDEPEISLDEGMARRLRVGIGDRVKVETDDTSVECVVSSLRHVERMEFGSNFRVVIEPGYLESTAERYLASAAFPEGKEQAIQDAVAGAYGNITLIQVNSVVHRITSILRRVGWGIRFLGLFIVAAGVAVLAGTIAVESQRRARDVALYKTIGMARAEVLGLFASEYALIGLVAAIIGITGGGAIAWAVVTRVIDIEFHLSALTVTVALAAGIVIAIGTGLIASLGPLRRKPIEVIRAE